MKIDKEKILEWYNSGQNTTQIAKKLKRTPRTVRRILKGKLIRHNRIMCDPSQLLNLKSEIGQYWHGYLTATGYISKNRNRLRCSITHKDIGHLYLLVKDLRSNIQPRKTPKRAYIDINNKELISLYRSSTYKGVHFWRGYIDGRGTVSTCHGYLKIGIRDVKMRGLFAEEFKLSSNRFWYGEGAVKIGRLLYLGCLRYLSRKAKIFYVQLT